MMTKSNVSLLTLAALAISAVVMAGQHFSVESRCTVAHQYKLKDPESMRILRMHKTGEDLYVVEYTATNGFGARVKNWFTCKDYGLGKGADSRVEFD